MITTVSTLSALVLGAMASATIKLFVSGVCPGVQSMCRWVMVATLAAGWLLGGLAALVAAFTSLDSASVIALAGAVSVIIQVGGWLLFLRWMFKGMSIRITLRNLQPALQAAWQPAHSEW